MERQASKRELPEKVQIVVPGVPRETVEKIDAMARAQGRSRAGQIRVLIARSVKKVKILQPVA